jgi:hypothetical protein
MPMIFSFQLRKAQNITIAKGTHAFTFQSYFKQAEHNIFCIVISNFSPKPKAALLARNLT